MQLNQLDTLRINRCKVSKENLDLLIKETVVYKHNRLRCLDLSYNFIFEETYRDFYGEHYKTFSFNFTQFCPLRYLESTWDDAVFLHVCKPALETTLFFRQLNPLPLDRMSLSKPRSTQTRDSRGT